MHHHYDYHHHWSMYRVFSGSIDTRLGQQDEQSAKERHQIDKLSQQLSDTTTQLAHISKVLDHLLTGHTPMTTLVDTPAAPCTSAENDTVPSGAASSLPQQGTASSKIHSTASSFQVNGQAAPHSHTEVQQDQAGPAQTQVHSSALSHSIRPLLATGPLLAISQTTTNATSMATDIATMAKVIPNVPLKLQKKIIQGEFIDLSELLQASF